MLAVVFLVCIAEVLTFAFTGLTLSEIFWKWSAINRTQGWIVMGCLALGWLALLFHLSKKMLFRKK